MADTEGWQTVKRRQPKPKQAPEPSWEDVEEKQLKIRHLARTLRSKPARRLLSLGWEFSGAVRNDPKVRRAMTAEEIAEYYEETELYDYTFIRVPNQYNDVCIFIREKAV